MDGKTLLRDLRQLLQEQADSSWLDTKTSYDYLYKAAIEFVSRTRINTSTQSITTVSDQAAYTLNADFMQMQLYDVNGEQKPYIKYYDGSGYTFIYHREYDPIVLENNTTSATVPSNWTVTDVAASSNVTGTQTAADSSVSNGEVLLTDSTAAFTTTVSVGDTIHNTSDSSSGVVQQVSSATTLYAALFDGTENNFDQNDAYVIVPQGRFKLVFDPPPSTAGHTVTVYYVQRPAPVYSDYRSYRIPIDYKQALIYYAAWMYKNRDKEPNYAELEVKYFEEQIRKACYQYGRALHRRGFRVNMERGGRPSGSWR